MNIVQGKSHFHPMPCPAPILSQPLLPVSCEYFQRLSLDTHTYAYILISLHNGNILHYLFFFSLILGIASGLYNLIYPIGSMCMTDVLTHLSSVTLKAILDVFRLLCLSSDVSTCMILLHRFISRINFQW